MRLSRLRASMAGRWSCPSCPGQADARQAGDGLPARTFYEPKWDGFRSIIFRDGDEVEIGSRKERPMTRYFPELVEAVARTSRRARHRRRDRDRGDGGLDFGRCSSASTRPRPGRHAAGRPRPPSSPSTCSRSATRTSPDGRSSVGAPRSRGRWRAPRTPVHLTQHHDEALAGLVRALRGRRPRRHHRQAARPRLPARQARHVQDQARAHRRRVLAGYRVHKGAPERSARCCSASSSRTARPSQWGDGFEGLAWSASSAPSRWPAAARCSRSCRRWCPPLPAPVELGGRRAPADRGRQSMEPRQGPELHSASPRAGDRGPLRLPRGRPFPPPAAVLRWRPDRHPAIVHLRSA